MIVLPMKAINISRRQARMRRYQLSIRRLIREEQGRYDWIRR